ncbi:MAG: hypothetical protein ACHP6H_03365, partial [Legionellales bacterium]
MMFAKFASAQTYSTGNEIKKADVNMTELANYYKEHPLSLVRKKPFNEADENEEERPKHRKPNPSEIHVMQREDSRNATNGPLSAYLPASPSPVDTFQSTISNGTIIPPDTHGAVDSQYCVTAINTAIHIQTRGGANVSVIGLDGFWSAILPAGTTSFDPRVHYDPFYKRWIMVTGAVNQVSASLDTTSTIMVAVSATNDPTGTWHMYAITVDPTDASWMDFPNVGFNSKWIMVTGNMFPNTGGGASGGVVYLFNYASIRAGTGAPFTKISQSPSSSIAPAVTYDPTEPNLFAIENWSGTSGTLRLWKISGAVGSPVMTSVGYPTSSQHWKTTGSGGFNGNFAPEAGGTSTTDHVNIGDDRITRVMYRNHTLWCSYTAFLPATGTATRSSIMWWQIDTNANPLQIGLIDDPTSTNFYAFSSLAVNVNNDVLVGFAAFSATTYPSAAYALHMNTDPLDSMRPLNIFRHGQAYYYETFGGGRNRWGDYSGACVDPRNDTDFWTIQESSIVGTAPNWDTWWAKVQFCPKPNAPTILSSPASLCIGASGTYKVNPITGATYYVWSVSGTGWSGTASSADTFNVNIGTGVGTINVLAYNACGEGESQMFHVTPAIVPGKPTISTITPACVGSPTAVFVAAVGGASSYSWQTLGTGWSGSGGSSSLTATVGTGTGMIICSAVNACGTGTPDTLLVTPAVVPTDTFSVATHVTNVNVNDVITFTGTAPTGSIYTWDFGGGIATPGTGAGPQTVYWTISGTKTVTLTVNNGGCTSTFSDTVHVGINAVKELPAGDKDIYIMPNPNYGSFKIVFNDPVNKA